MTLKKYTGIDNDIVDFTKAEYEGEGDFDEVAPYAFREHREIMEVHLPSGIYAIGGNAFYNCRNLSYLTFYDDLQSVGDGGFRNCSKLKYIEVRRAGGDLRGIKAILSGLNGSVTISIYGNKLYFPHYQESYQDNVGAKIVAGYTHGSGANYRACIGREEVDYIKYDKNFTVQKYEMELDESIAVCKLRLLYPVALRDENRGEYLEFLITNKDTVLSKIIKNKDSSLLKDYIRLGLFEDKSFVDSATDFFCENDFAEAVNIMLEYRNRNFKEDSISDWEI